MGKKAYKLQEFPAHTASVNSVKIGRKSSGVLVTGGDDKKVNMWAIGRPQAVLSLSGHQSPVECVTFDPGEEFVIAGASGGTIKVWDLDQAKVTRTFTGHRSNCVAIDCHPFGDFFASGSLDTNLKVWDMRRKGCIHTYKGHSRGITHIRFSPDGRWVLSGSEDRTVKLWDLTAGRMLKEFNAHNAPISAVEFHPNEFFMATSSMDRTTRFWDLESFESAGICPAEVTSTRTMCFHRHGTVMYTAHQDSLKVWGWEPIRQFDVVDVSWAKVSDISIHDNKLLGAGFYQSFVGIWVVDLEQVSPRPGEMESHYVIDDSGAHDGHDSTVDGEEADHVNTSQRTCDNIQNHEDDMLRHSNNMSLSRSFRRSIPSQPSYPTMFSDTSRGSDDECEPTPLSPSAGHDSQSQSSNQVREEGDGGQERSEGKLQGFQNQHEIESGRQINDEENDNVNIHNMLAEEKPGMVSVATVTGESLRGGALESLRDVRDKLQSTRLGKEEDIASNARTPFDRNESKRRESTSSGGTTAFQDMVTSLPVINIDSFLPSNCIHRMDADDEAVIAKILEPHAKILTILSSRLVNVQLVHKLMKKRDIRGALTAMLRLGDISVAADIFDILPLYSTSLSLENCHDILLLSEQLLEQKHDKYIRIALVTIELVIEGYGQLILDNMSIAKKTSGIDLNLDLRRQRCKACVTAFTKLQPTLATTALRMDLHGERAANLSSRVDEFCRL